jgi:CRP/FNR family transcriptional regulator
MGSAREVVTRMLKYFSSEGVVELSRGGIKVTDIKKLRNMAM